MDVFHIALFKCTFQLQRFSKNSVNSLLLCTSWQEVSTVYWKGEDRGKENGEITDFALEALVSWVAGLL
jgi:hypothetical protein